MIEALAPLEPGTIVWFGELHGTEQSPRFVGDVVAQAAARSSHVPLGLEIAAEEQGAIDRYLDDGDRSALLAGAFWQGQDGRSTPAAGHDYNVVSSGGTFWGCVSRDAEEPVCAEHRNFADRDAGPPWTFGPARDDSHDGVYSVGITTASRPLRSL